MTRSALWLIVGLLGMAVCLPLRQAYAQDAQRADDVAMALIFSFREATQIHLLAHALGTAALNGTPSQEVIDHCERAINSYEAISIPMLRKFAGTVAHDKDARDTCEHIQALQKRALAEVKAIKAMAESGNAQAERLAFVAANRAYNEVAQPLAKAIVTGTWGAERRGASAPARLDGPAKNAPAEFPISWRQFQQITGPEGGQTRYIRDADDELRRIEVRTGGDLLFAVTKVDSGFRLTIGQELAVADIASRGLLSGAESDALIEVYSELQGNGGRNRPERTAGRFCFTGERDPEFRIKPSIVISPSE